MVGLSIGIKCYEQMLMNPRNFERRYHDPLRSAVAGGSVVMKSQRILMVGCREATALVMHGIIGLVQGKILSRNHVFYHQI